MLTAGTRHIAFRTHSICLRTAKPQEWKYTDHIADLIPDAQRILRGQQTGDFGDEHNAPDLDLFATRAAARHVIIPEDLLNPPDAALFTAQMFWRATPIASFLNKVEDTESHLTASLDQTKHESMWVFKLREMPFRTIAACDNLLGEPNPNFFEMLGEYAQEPKVALKKLQNLLKNKHFPLTFGFVFPYQNSWFWQFITVTAPRRNELLWSRLGVSTLAVFASRITGVFDLELLKSKTVMVAGCGAIGSTIAVELASTGIGKLFLNDSDAVSVSNVVRHECSLANLGARKTEALKIRISLKNPLVEVIPEGDIFCDPSFEKKIEQSDLVICAIGDYNIEGYINQCCVRLGKPVIFAYIGIFGAVGHVVRTDTKSHATGCLDCFERYLKDGLIPQLPAINDPNVTIVETGCNNPSLPASSFDQKTIALIAVRKSLQYLNPEMYEDDTADAIVFYARHLDGVVEEQSLKTKKFSVPALEDCPVCGDGAHQ